MWGEGRGVQGSCWRGGLGGLPTAEVVVCAEGLHRTAFAPNPLVLLPRFFETGSWVVWFFF